MSSCTTTAARAHRRRRRSRLRNPPGRAVEGRGPHQLTRRRRVGVDRAVGGLFLVFGCRACCGLLPTPSGKLGARHRPHNLLVGTLGAPHRARAVPHHLPRHDAGRRRRLPARHRLVGRRRVARLAGLLPLVGLRPRVRRRGRARVPDRVLHLRASSSVCCIARARIWRLLRSRASPATSSRQRRAAPSSSSSRASRSDQSCRAPTNGAALRGLGDGEAAAGGCDKGFRELRVGGALPSRAATLLLCVCAAASCSR